MKEINVLFLDDEPRILSAVRRLLASEPFGVITTTDAAEALKIMTREKIKVVVSDERMPGMSGVQFLQKVKEQHPEVIRILFTGYADIAAAESAINISEVYRIINKPWNTQELKNTITLALEQYNLVIKNRHLFETTKSKNDELEILNKKSKREK